MMPAPSPGLLVFALVVLVLTVLLRRDCRRATHERSLRRACERALKHATHLSELGAALARAQTEADVVGASVVELVHALDATAGALIVIDPEGRTTVAHSVGYDSPPSAPEALQPGVRTPIAESIRRQELVTIESRAARPSDAATWAREDFLAGYDAAAVVPLVLGQRAIGAIALSFQRRRTFEGGEHALMLSAGRQVAQALE